MTTKRLSGSVVIAAFIALAGCVPKSSVQPVVSIGAVLPLTGSSAQWGIPPRDALLLAADEINAKGGISGRKVELHIEDDQCQPATATSAVQKILAVNKPVAIIGAICSSPTLAIAPIAERDKVVLISPGSTSPQITNAGDYIFRTIPSDALRGKVFAQYVFSQGHKRVSILYINNDGGLGNQQSFSEHFRALGGTITSVDAYPADTQDLRAQLTKIKQHDSDAVLVVSYPGDTPLVLRQAYELGLHKPLFFQTEALDDPAVLARAGKSANGATYILTALPDGPATQDFAKKYKSRYNREPELYAAEAYDALMLVYQCLSKGSVPSSDALKAALYKIQNYAGASGTISFDLNGDVIKPMSVKRIENGTATVVSTAQ
jgi:branched-chain amino acid transport system substrate-binding protein